MICTITDLQITTSSGRGVNELVDDNTTHFSIHVRYKQQLVVHFFTNNNNNK